MVEEDALMLGRMAWKELELRNADDAAQEHAHEPASDRSKNRLTHKQQAKVATAEGRRKGATETVLEGRSFTEARKNAVVRRDSARFAAAAGPARPDPDAMSVERVASIESAVLEQAPTGILLPCEDGDAYADELGARLLAIAKSVGTGARR